MEIEDKTVRKLEKFSSVEVGNAFKCCSRNSMLMMRTEEIDQCNAVGLDDGLLYSVDKDADVIIVNAVVVIRP